MHKKRKVLNVKEAGTYGYHCPSEGYRATEDQARKKTRPHMHQKQIHEIKILAREHFWLTLLKTKTRLLYLKTQFVPRNKHFPSRL